MTTTSDTALKEKLGRINSIDLLQGIAVAIMITTHVALWWDREAFIGQNNLFFAFFSFLGGFIAPTFLLLMGFNMRNSIARRLSKGVSFSDIRRHLLKRGFAFLLIATLNDLVMAILSVLVGQPENFLPWLISWELFHIFGTTVLITYFLYEIFHQLKTRNIIKSINGPLMAFCVFILILILIGTVLSQAIIGGDFSLNVLDPRNNVEILLFGEVANVGEAIQVAIARGPFSLFPFIAFGVLGVLLASLRLALPTEGSWRKTMLGIGVFFALIGGFLVIFLHIPIVFPINRYYLPSLSYIFWYWTGLIFAFLVSMAIFDAPSKAEKDRFRYVMPVARLSYLTLTIYYLQNLPFFLPNTLIPPSDTIMGIVVYTIVFLLYVSFYMVVAYFWEKKKFVYSMEWLLRKVTA
ncbi:MAG: heparan-alpha-glucosaminide N-acetyltransferase domain-containing protein [Candidatus Hermodarchaeota archaeon]